MHDVNDSNGLLLYRVGPVLVCSSTMPVEAVIMPPKITVPPGANVAEPGVFKSIHGMVRLVDLRVRFGVDENDYTHPGKIIIVEVEGGHAGFWVDEIEDVTGFPETGWAKVPAYIPSSVFSRTWIKGQSIRLYADFEKLDKFKTSGYLRKHIEMLKSADVKIADEKIKNITKNILSEKTEENIVVEGDRSKTSRPKKNKPEENKPEESRQEQNKIEKVSIEKPRVILGGLENKNIKLINHEKKVVISVVNNSDENKGKVRKNKNIDGVAGANVKANNFRAATGLDVKFKNEITNNKMAANVDSMVKPEIIEKKSNYSLTNSLQSDSLVEQKKHAPSAYAREPKISVNSYGKKNKDEIKSGLIWKLIFGLMFVGFIYLIYEIVGSNVETNEFNVNTKFIEYIEENNELENQVSETIDVSEIEATSENKKNEIESPMDEMEMHKENKESESTVKISKLEDGVLIVINEYESDNKNTNLDFADMKEIESEADVFKSQRRENIDNKSGGANSESVRDEIIEINANKAVIESVFVDEVIRDPIEKNKVKVKINVTEKPTKPSSRKYVHIVAKGDTLWHIAKRYVNNPWRYPELARLSRIQNPDLIYPGDKVTIIINYKK